MKINLKNYILSIKSDPDVVLFVRIRKRFFCPDPEAVLLSGSGSGSFCPDPDDSGGGEAVWTAEDYSARK